MSATVDPHVPAREGGWFTKTEAWMDERGKGAWIAAMILGFIFFWPVGLALLAYMIWSKRMFGQSCRSHGKHHRHHHHHGHGHRFDRAASMGRRHGFASTGNSAFDAYKAETLQRLMDEQEQFEAFLDRLREAKDKQEFDQFMTDRAEAARRGPVEADDKDLDDDGVVVADEPKS